MSTPHIERIGPRVYLLIGADRFELGPADLLRLRTEIDDNVEPVTTCVAGTLGQIE